VTLIAHHGVTPSVHPTAFVAPGAVLIGDVDLGSEASVWFGCVVRADINRIRLGERSNLQDGCVIHVTHALPVEIGVEVTIGHRAVVHGCTIGDGALVGMGAVILDGARIGAEALVAAGALVREGQEVPPGMLAAGVPARVVRALTESERGALRESARRYVRHVQSYGRNEITP
jgi:carbonic anhydrase/acetyltransferase-like protein (isoleucine patch superfamily)